MGSSASACSQTTARPTASGEIAARSGEELDSAMLFERQRLLLTLLDAAGAALSHTDFQKLLVLYTHECEASPSCSGVAVRSRSPSATRASASTV